MKIILGLLVLSVAGLLVVYNLGGISSFSPAQQAENLKKDAAPGTPWQTIAQKYPPKRYVVHYIDDKGFPSTSTEAKYEKVAFDKAFKDGDLKYGFAFVYLFSAEHEYEVHFDEEGKFRAIQKRLSMGDLMKPNPYGN